MQLMSDGPVNQTPRLLEANIKHNSNGLDVVIDAELRNGSQLLTAA
jgi:hypothetical protein